LLQASLDRDAEARRRAPAVRTAGRGKRPVQVPEKKPSAGIHVVQPNETIGGIAKRYGVSVQQLTRWNDLQRGVHIFPGDRLRVASVQADQGQGGFR
jgi:LysM repeat protein